MATTTRAGDLQALAAAFRGSMDRRDQAASSDLTAAWAAAYGRIQAELAVVTARIAAAQEAGTRTSPAWALQHARLNGLLDTTARELDRYAATASEVTRREQAAAIRTAQAHAARLAASAVTGTGVDATFLATNPANVEQLAGHLADGSPLANLFAGMGDDGAREARRIFATGLATGKNPSWMARRITAALDTTRSRAETIARTETLRAYRETTRATYQANDDVLGGWTWHAKLDARTCPACIAMHGTIHSLDDRLDGHPNCRCAMLPRTKTWDEILGEATGIRDTNVDQPSGAEWFDRQPDTLKRAVLGPAKFSAYQDGEITLADVVAQTDSRRWGSMRRERSLVEIREGRNANPPVRYPGDTPPPAAARPNPGPTPPAPPVRPAAQPVQAPAPVTPAPGATVAQPRARTSRVDLPPATLADTPAVTAARVRLQAAMSEHERAAHALAQHQQVFENHQARIRGMSTSMTERAKLAAQDPAMVQARAAVELAAQHEVRAWDDVEEARRAVLRAVEEPPLVQPTPPPIPDPEPVTLAQVQEVPPQALEAAKPSRADQYTLENTADWSDEQFMELMGEAWDDPDLMMKLEAIIEARETMADTAPRIIPPTADPDPAPPIDPFTGKPYGDDSLADVPAVDPFTGKPYAGTPGAPAARKAPSRAEALEENYRNYVDHHFITAQDEMAGNFLNPEGKRKGIDAYTLFHGADYRTVRKYASEELIAYFEREGRHTKTSFDYMLNQTPSSYPAFERVKRAGFAGQTYGGTNGRANR